MQSIISRRQFLTTTAAALACAGLRAAPAAPKYHFCAFEKPLQFLSYDDMAQLVADAGYNGIEATARSGGHILPERIDEDLPRMIEALQKRNLDLTILTSDITSVEQPLTEKVLRTAAKHGVKRYRMMWYKYDTKQPILPQLDAIAKQLPPLVELTRSLGMTALYQNHNGANMVGAPIWDIYQLIKNFDPKTIGLAFDIMHATIEGGHSWPIQFKLVQSHIAAVYIKDFKWADGRVAGMPLGQGQVDPKYFTLLKQSGYTGPVSVHVEYLDGKKDRAAFANAFKTDLVTLKKSLQS